MLKFDTSLVKSSTSNLTLFFCDENKFEEFLNSLPRFQKNWIYDNFKKQKKNFYLVPNKDGKLSSALAIIKNNSPWNISEISNNLPAGNWKLNLKFSKKISLSNIQLGWELSQYRFKIRKNDNSKSTKSKLVLGEKLNEEIIAIGNATTLVREMINLPPNIMNIQKIEKIIKELKDLFSCNVKTFENNTLEKEFPAIHTVGKSSENRPKLLDLSWGKSGPKITIVGKGITFDTGGLNIKSTKGMELMKKDMGGAAHAIGLAYLLMKLNFKIKLRLIIPVAENSISRSSMRPSDIINTRSGKKVEIGNTDAEGRLLLADALFYSINSLPEPDFLVDFATLTGAARIALGSECPAIFCNNDETAKQLMEIGKKNYDPVWQLPLLDQYDRYLDTSYAAISSTGNAGGYGGAITAALFLRRFVGKKLNWAHFDVMAWNLTTRPGRPTGGEAMGIRSTFEYIKKTYT